MSGPDQQRRLIAQLTLFKDRLLDINTRNPSLLLRREVQARCFDLAKLGKETVEAVFERLFRGSSAIRLVANNRDDKPAVQMRRHLQELARAARARTEETGLQELYVGICWVTGHVEAKAYLRGPLLLVPARLELGQGKRDAGWSLLLAPEEMILNEAIGAALRKHRGVRLPDTFGDDLEAALDALRAQKGSTEDQHRRVFAEAIKRLNEAGLRIVPGDPSLVQPLVSLTSETIPKIENDLKLTGEVVLGLFPQSSTALHADIETMIDKAENGEVDLGIVDNLLEAPADEAVTADDLDEPGRARGQDIPEAAVHAVVACDPSQHLVLKTAQKAECLVVRGPPGTGKSQVIVNLVADALARDKRVLVVCQKRAALDVVFRRLDDVGLSSSAALVHDAMGDRADLYKRLHAQMQSPAPPVVRTATSATGLAADIDELTRSVRSMVDPLGLESHGLPLYEIYARSRSAFRPQLDLPQELMAAHYRELQRAARAIERAKPGRLRFDVDGHPLALRANWANFGHVDSARLERSLGELALEAGRGDAIARVPNLEIARSLAAEVHAFLALRVRWYRWFVPRWWRAQRAVRQATAWFGQASVEIWSDLLDRQDRLVSSLDSVGTVMQQSWRATQLKNFGDLPRLAAMASEAQAALRRELDDIRAHDRIRSELKSSELTVLDQCARHLSESVDWGAHIRQEAFVRWIDEAEASHPRLRDRLAPDYQAMRAELEKKIAERRSIVASELAAKLRSLALTPTFQGSEKSRGNRKPQTDWNKLTHEFGKKRCVKPLRTLIAEFGWPMKQLVRCWLASPEVVAEVFPLDRAYFDVVIFDEASQLTLERALPVLYRGAQVVIAGDEQQMPPSDFFGASLGEEAEETSTGENETSEARFAESLLSQAKRVYGFRYLAWHYRSQYQQLIEFSNHAFYDGALQVAANLDCGNATPPIQWIPVRGVWIDQTNPVEVVRTVDELKRVLHEHALNPKSVGVITFNQKQQTAILDEIDKRRKEDPEFDALYSQAENPTSGSLDDKPFVKNIENVQGDERDYVLFSIGYAPGPDGVLRRNFGPLGLSGGENRLNVAVTRAKRGIRVICSFDPDTLAVETAKNRGPVLLKKYLQYARAVSEGDTVRLHGLLSELNPEQRAPENVSGAPSFDSPLEEQIYDALRQRGLKVYTQWGAGGYHIDLVIVHPHDPNRLCLGIECDGARYHSGRSVRERDVARQAFLENRGWKIHRIWSRDWWKDPEGEVQRVLAQLPSPGHGATNSARASERPPRASVRVS